MIQQEDVLFGTISISGKPIIIYNQCPRICNNDCINNVDINSSICACGKAIEQIEGKEE